ncbi:organic cation transporter-like protein [Lineus longissimus]|uniref:organic cation transporter-like protein n=1 Tax=Lineus longissimus TaxID=88925 RepID=UPI002B4F8F46
MKLDDIFVDRIGDWGRFQTLAVFFTSLSSLPMALHTVSLIFIGGSEQSYWCALPTNEFDNFSHEALKDVFIPSKLGADGVKVYSKCEIYNLDNNSRQDISEAITAEAILKLNSTFYASGVSDNQTTATRRCNAWQYGEDGRYKTSLLTQYGLYCEREWLLPLSQTLFMAGWMAGNIVFGSLADRYGRMKVIPLGFLVNTAIGIAMPFIPNYFVYIFFRFLIGVTSGGPYTVLYVLALELCGKKYRICVSSCISAGFNISLCLMAGIGYAMAPVNHITMQLIIGSIPFIIVFYHWIFHESPRWLVSMHRYEGAKVIVKKIAKFNKRPKSKYEDDMLFEEESAELSCDKSASLEKLSEKKYTALDLFRTPNIRRITIATYVQWFSCAFVWYGMIFAGGSLGANVYINLCISGIVGIVGNILCVPLLNFFGRRPTTVTFMTLMALSLLASIPLVGNPEFETALIAVVFVGKLCTVIAFDTIWLHSTEVFPTCIRAVGVSTGCLMARLGALISPLVAKLATIQTSLPLIVFATVAVLATFCCIQLPETNKRRLPETIEEGEEFAKFSLSCRKPCKKKMRLNKPDPTLHSV